MSDTASKTARKKEIAAYKRQKILTAASSLFREKGLEGTTMRAIATKAGYSTGAPYAYFQSKEEIYADLLSTSLMHLTRAIKLAPNQAETNEQKIRQVFTAYYQYYQSHGEELQLGLYLFSSGEIKKRGFSKETNDQLNGRLLSLMGFMANYLHQLAGAPPDVAQSETLDAITYFTGTLMLHTTGRLDIMQVKDQEMIDRYLTQMLKRITKEKEK
ncbi:TetR/AcrR family transcriptional regulator [Sneathiella aquimaris]|uniref:TetR/AcrR family transcriptional regulator n=1 Tax=Sneathiella aquimaris TaxID=2599305 RepID=UPI00146C8396|nr:TetR/AcrR family transcriptional regulator [Sneathiella aquimaris]